MYAATRLIRGGCKTCQALGKPSLIVSLPPETPAHAPPRSPATGLQEGGKLTVHGHHNSSLVHIIAEDSCRTGWHMQPASFIGVSEYQLFTSSLLYTIFLSSSHPTICMLLRLSTIACCSWTLLAALQLLYQTTPCSHRVPSVRLSSTARTVPQSPTNHAKSSAMHQTHSKMKRRVFITTCWHTDWRAARLIGPDE